jgi:two-component system, chemotaxis family, response regulator PixG
MTDRKNNICFRDSIVEFNQIKTTTFTGNVIIQVTGTPSWMLSFSAGRLAGIGGGIDAIGRWTRSLALASLNVPVDRLVKSTNREEIFLNSNKLAQEWAVKEILFDIIQFSQNRGDRLSFQIIPTHEDRIKLNSSLPLLDLTPLLHATIQSWYEWERNGLASYPPSLFPWIQKPEQISQFNDDSNLQYLLSEIDGKRSLRSLAIHLQRSNLDVAMNLLPLLKMAIVNLVAPPQSNIDVNIIDDTIVAPISITEDKERKVAAIPNSKLINKNSGLEPLVICIDDSPIACKRIEKIIANNGYRYLAIQDSQKIIPTLIKAKPDLIFLDLVMPGTNGYEVCEQIRKTPCLANVPVVILTGSDGLIDRVRSKFVGANGFLGKPASAETILKTIDKYLDKTQFINGSIEPNPGEPVILERLVEIPKDGAKRILIIDDDDSIREVVSMCLRKLKGWDIQTAASGQEGLNRVRTHQPDAILLDVMMPNMDGLAFLRALRADYTTQRIPVLLLTANVYLPGKPLLTKLGVVDIINKPFIPLELARQIAVAIS